LRSTTRSTRRNLALAGSTLAFALAIAVPASAQDGGSGPPGSTTTTTTPTTTTPTTTGVATLAADGSAIPPVDAPRAVRKAINAGNKIRFKPYLWGGGHASFKAKGYDCSGAVSYLLHAAGLLKRPLASGPLASSWGSPGTGAWITVYANRGHTYIVVAGLRFDTSAVGESVRSGSGPRWRGSYRSPVGYMAKYYPSL
jgi:cell wall-associated NlpC family hydrolase